MTRPIDPKLAESDATQMLAGALAQAFKERGLSLRKIGPLLGYKQAAVLSHMATGRVPIPIDKAEEIARVLEMNQKQFLQAVVKQRHPEVRWSLLSGYDDLAEEGYLDGLGAGMNDADTKFNPEQRAVMKEMLADPHPRRRWLSTEEATALETLRLAGSRTEVPGKPMPRAIYKRDYG
jgi:hypothetical protein